MKGLELCRRYYAEFGAPMLAAQFPEVLPHVAVGLLGPGSECLGFDDELSRDHDFEPGFCIILPGEDIIDRRTEFALSRAYAKLPREFLGFARSPLSPVGGNRHGPIRREELLLRTTGTPDGALSLRDWLQLPEQSLLELTGGELVEGDTKQAVFETKNESGDIINQLINVGTINSNGPKLEFKDKNGVDVTHLYAVEIISGTLTVEQRPLLIQTKNGELTYSGTEQSYPEFEQMDEYLLDGHEIRVIEDKAAKYLDCGEYENTLSFVILDRDGNDVSANYSINVGYGQVTVKPRKVTVTTRGTGDSPFEYNGKDQTLPKFDVDNATEVDECATTGFAVRDVGTYENRFEVAFFRDTENVSYNYEIEYVYGVLEVVPLEVSLKLTDASKEYDGTPLTSTKHEYVAGSPELVEGHNLTLETNGSITRPDEETVVNEYGADSATSGP